MDAAFTAPRLQDIPPVVVSYFTPGLETRLANSASSPGVKLDQLYSSGWVGMQRAEEGRSALFSHWHQGVLAWNKEEMTTIGPPPTSAFWDTVMVRAAACSFLRTCLQLQA